MIMVDEINNLIEILNVPKACRHQAIHEKLSSKSHDDLIKILEVLMTVSENYAESCDEALYLHLVITGDMHPHSIEKLISPKFDAALKGLLLSEKAPNQDVLCDGCAYKEGTLANHCSTTQSDLSSALNEGKIFYCHEGFERLDVPTKKDQKCMKPCKGWAQHIKNVGKA